MHPTRARRPGPPGALVGERLSTIVAIALTAGAVGALLGWALISAGFHPGDWDLLFVSGCLTVLAGLWLARGQHDSFEGMLERLANRGSIARARGRLAPGASLDAHEFRELEDALGARTERWSSWFGISLGIAIAVVWVVLHQTRGQGAPLLAAIGGPLVGGAAGYLVGRAVGRMISYGMLGRFLSDRGLTYRAMPGHIDGAAGLKPIGDFYLHQALLLTLPAVFLLVWSLLFLDPKWTERYGDWQGPYLALLALAIVVEIAAFVAPMWRAHVAMKEEKRRGLVTVDTTLGNEIATAGAKLGEELTVDERTATRERLESLMARYDAIESMPTWPMDRKLRRRVTLGNAALILGLVGQLIGLAGWS